MLTRGCVKVSQNLQVLTEQQAAISSRSRGCNTSTRVGRGQSIKSVARVARAATGIVRDETNFGEDILVADWGGSITNEVAADRGTSVIEKQAAIPSRDWGNISPRRGRGRPKKSAARATSGSITNEAADRGTTVIEQQAVMSFRDQGSISTRRGRGRPKKSAARITTSIVRGESNFSGSTPVTNRGGSISNEVADSGDVVEQQAAISFGGLGCNTNRRRGRGRSSKSADRVTAGAVMGETNFGQGTPAEDIGGSITNEVTDRGAAVEEQQSAMPCGGNTSTSTRRARGRPKKTAARGTTDIVRDESNLDGGIPVTDRGRSIAHEVADREQETACTGARQGSSKRTARETTGGARGETNFDGGTPPADSGGSIANELDSTLHPLSLHQLDEDSEATHDDEDDDDETLEAAHTTAQGTCHFVSDVDPCFPKIRLDPKRLWFKHSKIKREITKVIKQHYKEPWFCWSATPDHVKDEWYCAFKEKCTWDPIFEQEARKGFEEGGTDRLKDVRYKAQRRRDDNPPKWMPMEIFRRLKEKALDPEFKERSERARRNRKSGSQSDKCQPGHCIGSISLHELAERMAAEKNGALPTAAEVYARAHSKTTPEGKTIFYGNKAEETLAKFQERQQQYESQNITKNPNEVYYEVVGGHNKGTVPGLGTSADLFYNKGRCASSTTCTTPYTPSVVVTVLEDQLTQQRQEYERVARELEDQKSKTTILEEQFQLQQQQMRLMHQQFETLGQLIQRRQGYDETRHKPQTSTLETSTSKNGGGAPQSPGNLLQLIQACEEKENRGSGSCLRKRRRI